MHTTGTWTDTLEYARKHRYLLKTKELDQVVMTAIFGSHINQLRAYAYSSRMSKVPTAINESYLREIDGFMLSSIHMRTELNNMAAYLEIKMNIQMEDISVKMNAMTCEVTLKPVRRQNRDMLTIP